MDFLEKIFSPYLIQFAPSKMIIINGNELSKPGLTFNISANVNGIRISFKGFSDFLINDQPETFVGYKELRQIIVSNKNKQATFCLHNGHIYTSFHECGNFISNLRLFKIYLNSSNVKLISEDQDAGEIQ